MAGLSLEMGACIGSGAEDKASGLGDIGRASKSLAAWKASGAD